MSFVEDDKKTIVKTFTYVHNVLTCDKDYILEIPIEIPYTRSVNELTDRIINSFRLPIYLKTGLEEKLKTFISDETIAYQDKLASTAIHNAKKSIIDVEDAIKKWEKSFKQETVEYGERRRTSDSEVFSNVYHTLVHSSPAFQTMLQVEQSYALAVSKLLTQKDEQISSLMNKQTQEVDAVIAGVNVHNTEQDVNKLFLKNVEELNLLQGKWNSEVDTLKESQRKEYRDWLIKLLEDQQTSSSSGTLFSSMVPPTQLDVSSNSMKSDHVPVLEESFTIHLGSQMKQMHNIRILSADVLDFCKIKPAASGSSSDPSLQRLQTALGLYSNDLCGLVLLKNKDDVGSLDDLSKEFYSICESSTEFHFPSVTDQLESLKSDIKEAILWRQSGQQCGNLTSSEQQSRQTNSKNLQPGDVFITRHSNLSNIHVMLHLIIDDTVKSNEINSRHPSILGLRNILKTACSNDITTLTIPLLLMHEMTEEMTIAWCKKRAELVFKCVKGFMIEMATWGGSELKNVQFLVPKDISEDVFMSLATMLPDIFRVSTLVFKAWPSPSTPKNNSSNK